MNYTVTWKPPMTIYSHTLSPVTKLKIEMGL